MSCGGRGLCGCGDPECALGEWWRLWCTLWFAISFEYRERLMSDVFRNSAESFDADMGSAP